MKLLVLVLNDESLMDEILLGLNTLGIKGATIIDSIGMGSVLGTRLPIYKSIEKYISIEKPNNKTMFTVVNDDELLHESVDFLKMKLDLQKPGTGFMFVLPVLEIYGTAQISENDGEVW